MIISKQTNKRTNKPNILEPVMHDAKNGDDDDDDNTSDIYIYIYIYSFL